jgi:four helix bundle protein
VIRSHRDLVVWQDAMELAETCYRLTATMPATETYGLVGQMRRAAVSVPANIAEGFARRSRKTYLHHLLIAAGSLAELDCLLDLAQRVRFLPEKDSGAFSASCQNVRQRLNALVYALQQSTAERPRHLAHEQCQRHDVD